MTKDYTNKIVKIRRFNERFWVKVVEMFRGTICGIVDNDLLNKKARLLLPAESRIYFQPDEIIDVWKS